MKFKSSLLSLVVLAAAFSVGSVIHVTATSNNFSQTYPAVVCPPTLNGLNSQVSIASSQVRYQRLENRSTKTIPFRTLRFPVQKDSLVITADGVTPTIWQSRSGSWAGGTICSGPSSSQWFVGGSANVTTKGYLLIVNSGLSDAVVDIQSYSENGKQPLQSVNLKSKNFKQIALDSLAPGDKSLVVHVTPRSGRINSFMIDEQGAGLKALGGDFVNAYPDASRTIVIAAIPNQLPKKGQKASSAHTLRILSPGEVSTNFTAEILSADGRFIPVGLSSELIEGGIVSEFVLSPKISASAFALRITSPEPIIASVSSSVTIAGRKDFVWSTSTPQLKPMNLAITGLSPLIVFAGDSINVRLQVTLVNKKKIRKSITGSDIATWRVPENSRSISIISASKDIYAAGLVASSNGYGFIPMESGSSLTKVEIPNSNIRVLNP